MEREQLKSILEALIFYSEEPVTEKTILGVLESDGIEKAELRETIQELRSTWNDDASRGLKLAEVAGGYQFRTKEGVAEWVKRLGSAKPARLSQAAMETLAIVAYRQPIIRSEVEHVRGVDCGGVLKTLVERNLVRIVGKRDEPGQPLIYGTTKEFLELFELANLKDLPPLKELRELAQKRLGFDAEGEGGEGEAGESPSEDEEEPTAVIRNEDDDDEEPTEIISRLEKDEEEDKEALANLEQSIKGLRRLEKTIFPKPEPKPEPGSEAAPQEGYDAGIQTVSEEEAGRQAEPNLAEDDAPEQVDSARK